MLIFSSLDPLPLFLTFFLTFQSNIYHSILLDGVRAAGNACHPQNHYSTDVNQHLCLFFEDGRCKRYLGQESVSGWTGFLPNPFDWAFKVFSPGKQTYVHGVPTRNKAARSLVPDHWCPVIVQDLQRARNLHPILSSGCSMNHGEYRWYERSCSARSACRCLTNPRDNLPFCTDGTEPATTCKGSGNPSKFPAMSSPIGPNGKPKASRGGSHPGGRGIGGRGHGVGGQGGSGSGKGGKGKPDPFDWFSMSWRKRPPPTIAGGRGGHYTLQVAKIKENMKTAKKDLLALAAKAADQFNPDTQPKCGPLMPDCSAPKAIMSHVTGMEVPAL